MSAVVDRPLSVEFVEQCATATLNSGLDKAQELAATPQELMQGMLFAYVSVAMQITGATSATQLVPDLRIVFKDFADELEAGKVVINFEKEEGNAIN